MDIYPVRGCTWGIISYNFISSFLTLNRGKRPADRLMLYDSETRGYARNCRREQLLF